MVLEEIDFIKKSVKQWAKPEKVQGSLLNFPSSNYIHPSPFGVSLIIGAWNYPFQLTLAPLVGAIAAGNCAILKPSEMTPHTSALIKEMIESTFDDAYIAVVEGGIPVNQTLLKQPFDKIFFTGSPAVGKIVMKAAAENLTSVTLELGGKSPCIVEKTADLEVAARRIVWGRVVNGGRTCEGPDYLVVHEEVKKAFVDKLKKYITEQYGSNPLESPDYPRIINRKHFDRLTAYLSNGQVVAGGETIAEENYIAPTLLDEVAWEDDVMQEEIFGPILPILTYSNEDLLIAKIRKLPKPLAFYMFSTNRSTQKKFLKTLDFGGASVNDTISHLINPHLPFGGVGNSGAGAYHGKASFDVFTHFKSVMKRANWLDVPLRYAPYKGKLQLIKQAFKWMA